MTIRLREVVRSEVEGGLSGPANPIPSESIDCGCGQWPCPKLAKFATRRLFVGLMSWVGLVQAAAYAYFYVTGPTIARRFQFDPYIMDWILAVSELTPFLLGIFVAYWGDRIHRSAWVGGLALVQSAAYFLLIIPHLTHNVRVIEETDSVSHMSLYADDSQELCLTGSSRVIIEETEPCYVTMSVLIAVQIVTGMANIAYYALGISYLDDNTKKKHVGSFIGVILAVKTIGILLGYVLAWGCLRIDAGTLQPVESYREQIGAWWLGFPILSLLLVVPALLLSWFPRMLPSEVVELAAASLLNSSGRFNRAPRRLNSQKVGSPNFLPSLGRMFANRILMLNGLATILYATALVNFMTYENVILESRFHIPRPTGLLLGFGDPMSSRLISTLLKPILISLIVIISGLVIAKAKPTARCITIFNIVAIILAAGVIFSLTAAFCDKKPIVGTDSKGSIFLPKYCNKNCGCSNDANFRPICDSKGMFTFYSPCHAGCTSALYKDGVTTYSGCSCVEEMTGLGNKEAKGGPCTSSTCQIGWLIFEFGTLLAYALIASTFVGDLLITLRSVNAQDKAISIGFWMTWAAIIVNVPGKILYEVVANLTCQYWGSQKWTCHLHDSLKLGDYMCYLTGSILVLCFLLKILVWFFCKSLKLYVQREELGAGTEMQDLVRDPSLMPAQQLQLSTASNNSNVINNHFYLGNPKIGQNWTGSRIDNTSVPVEVNDSDPKSSTAAVEDEVLQQKATQHAPLKYGPLGPGDQRTDVKPSNVQSSSGKKSRIRNMDSEDELSTSDEDCKKDSSPKVAYIPLDLDSDVESELSSVQPRSRKRVVSKDYDQPYNSDQGSSSIKSFIPRRGFPNPDHYEDPRLSRSSNFEDQNGYPDGSAKTNSFEYAKKRQENDVPKKGDFNEVGIPIIDPIVNTTNEVIPDSRFLKDVKSLINRYEQNTGQEDDKDASSIRSTDGSEHRAESKIVSGIPLVAMTPKRSSGRSHGSSGFNSSVEDKFEDARSESRASNSPKTSNKGSKGALCTDL